LFNEFFTAYFFDFIGGAPAVYPAESRPFIQAAFDAAPPRSIKTLAFFPSADFIYAVLPLAKLRRPRAAGP
jgi:hypothetical protein